MFAIGIGTRFQLRLNTSRGGGGKSVSNPAVRSITPSLSAKGRWQKKKKNRKRRRRKKKKAKHRLNQNVTIEKKRVNVAEGAKVK